MSKNKDNIKSYCYSDKCGPVVRTGFTDQYWVCKQCKEEISDRLANEIKSREDDKKKKNKLNQEELDLAEMWGMVYGGKLPDGNDDGFY